jgi:hypothetical protein
MNCSGFRRWLDERRAAVDEGAAREHALRCAACSTLLEAQQALDALLSAPPASLPDRAGFVDRVMRRVEIEIQSRARVDLWPATPLPWWVQAAADPAAMLAFLLAALLVLKVDWLPILVRFTSDRWSAFATRSLDPARATLGLDRPAVTLGLELLGLMALGWLSIQLYRWSERVARRSAGPATWIRR